MKIASNRIIAALRNRQFLSLEELQHACQEELEKINNKALKGKDRSRWDLFLSEEKEHLLPLCTTLYEVADWSTAKVQINSHISFAKHFYSVPYEFLQKEVDVRSTRQIVEIFYHQERIASHVRLWTQQTYATIREHMPPNKQYYQDWDADRFLKWSRQYGSETVKVVTSILESSPIVQQTFKACLGVMSMAKKHSATRLERACKLACQRSRTPTYRMVKDILSKEEDLAAVPLPTNEERQPTVIRGHQRGASYFGGGRHVES